LYPNPNTGEFFISIDGSLKAVELRIYNSLGELIMKNNLTEIKSRVDTRAFSHGIYYITLSSQWEIIFSQKLLME